MSETTVRETMLSLPVDALAAVHRALADGRTPAEAAEAARRLGFETGPGFHRALEEWLAATGSGDPSSLDPAAFWERLSDFFAAKGWGRLDFERLHPGVAALSSDEWAEAETEGSASYPACHFTTGLLADLLGRASGADLAVLEVECRSKGDARCRFLVGGWDALERVYDELSGGAPYAESIQRLS
jgi:V4R domain